jgi:DoxX
MLQNRHRNHQLVMLPQLAQFTDVALLLLRVMVGIVFITSGWNHLKDPEARSKDIGMSKGFTIFLGASEVAGSLGVIFWRSHATRCGRFDIANARRDSEKDFRLAHRLLG